MYIENIVIGKPVAEPSTMFAADEDDWERNEKEKIYNLEYYLDRYAIPDASCHKIKIIPKIRKIIASNFMGKAEYELDYEEYKIVNKALQEQLQRYKDEYKNLKCE